MLFRKKALPIISANTKLAVLILRGAHQGSLQLNHWKSHDALARSCEVAYIYHSTDLAKNICEECALCTMREFCMACQSVLSSLILEFSNTCYDCDVFLVQKTPHPNIKAGDVCLLHESLGKHSVASYKYCKVMQAKPNQDGLLRKAVIKYYNVPSMKAKRREVDIWQLTLLPSVDNCHQDRSYKH